MKAEGLGDGSEQAKGRLAKAGRGGWPGWLVDRGGWPGWRAAYKTTTQQLHNNYITTT